MMVFDADIMIDLLRQYPPAVDWLQSVRPRDLVCPGYVAMELIWGFRNASEQQVVDRFLGDFRIVWGMPETCDRALSLFARYHLSRGIDITDALVAQLAIDLGANLVTFNRKHYGGISGLKTVQPYARSG
ncbi:MAG: PIN domain-containing protein [Armatimonadetes bacterium]|nr:PIN domain-containing protein [Armatimonadota bacterium]